MSHIIDTRRPPKIRDGRLPISGEMSISRAIPRVEKGNATSWRVRMSVVACSVELFDQGRKEGKKGKEAKFRRRVLCGGHCRDAVDNGAKLKAVGLVEL